MIRFWLAALACLLAACRPVPPTPPQPAIVILVSIDGWRWDYLDRYAAPTVATLAAEGVRADGLIPQFPSKTFPNHYTIVTGLRLANHGIISNNMRAADVPGEFAMSNRQVLADPRWWGGEPIWNTLERQGGIASAMFWPGSEAAINGRHATYWMPYDDDLSQADRVGKILEWLKLPDGRRPSFLTLYYAEVDTTGHRYGPQSDEVRAAIRDVDASLAQLVAGVRELRLDDRVHYVLVSDHGMSEVARNRAIVLDDYITVADADVVDWSPVLGLSPKDGNVDRMYAALKDRHPRLAVYRRDELPAVYGLAAHPRLPAIIGIADDGWQIVSRRDTDRWREPESRSGTGGQHGYDSRLKSMQGLFVAAGPRIRSGLRVAAFENIHVYDFMCALLGVTPAKNDGDAAVTRDMLHNP
ncbi:MAG TPA: ectonucleotide pyrophosphatase/phosphodiesterase [Vicinamibacterales bacterium]|nr:ectonucleotide pyrophosphatase/phosphodiesterase [Vicinamibacterales bacterium]